MAKIPSVERYERALRERHEELNKSLSDLHKAIASLKPDRIEPQALNCARFASNLEDMLHDNDTPSWLPHLRGCLRRFESARDYGELLTAIKFSDLVRSHDWSFSESETPSMIDFERIYRECYRESKLPELLQKLLEYVMKIAESGEIDQISVMDALQLLQETIKKSIASRSFVSSIQASCLVKRFFVNTGLAILKDIPGIKYLVEGVEKTLEEIEVERRRFPVRAQGIIDAQIAEKLPKKLYGLELGPSQPLTIELSPSPLAQEGLGDSSH